MKKPSTKDLKRSILSSESSWRAYGNSLMANTIFDAFAEDAIFESRYHFPDWATMISGRANRGTASSNPSNDVANYSAPGLQRMLSAARVSFQAWRLVPKATGPSGSLARDRSQASGYIGPR